MPLQQTSGAASYDAFGGGVAVVPNYIEDVFSTWLYNGGNPPKTITNGIDLAGKGGLVWTKSRNLAEGHRLVDTVRGATKALLSNESGAQVTETGGLTSFSSTGYVVSFDSGYNGNTTTDTYVGWTFRKAPKFFDVVTYTGNGAGQGARAVPHNLQSSPGCIIIKATSATSQWAVWHRYAGVFNEDISGLSLNSTGAATGYPNATSALMNSTSFDPANIYGTDFVTCNANGVQYVAYLFAHNAGGFGLTGTDNVISCGSFSPNGSSQDISLGYEPQWILIKRTAGARDWFLVDNMRGWTANSASDNCKVLNPNLSAAESDNLVVIPTATGFTIPASSALNNDAHIYIAIRRGPMKVPTDGTKVFAPVTQTSTGSAQAVSTSFPVDFTISRVRGATSANYVIDRLRGSTSASARILVSNTTDAEYSGGPGFSFDSNTQITDNGLFGAGTSVIYECFRRAPGFFDEVCYTGTGSATTQAHNLTVPPELMIIKSRGTAETNWSVYSRFTPTTYGYQTLQTDSAGNSSRTYGPGGSPNFEELSAAPTATAINLASSAESNASGRTFVAYLFASCPGVSKVGSYTGTGTTQTINCGFTGGARFVLIKRTDSTGDWYVWDSARGIVASNDPYLLLNSTAAEVTNTDFVDTAATGFEISSTAPAAINASGGTFIFLAIA